MSVLAALAVQLIAGVVWAPVVVDLWMLLLHGRYPGAAMDRARTLIVDGPVWLIVASAVALYLIVPLALMMRTYRVCEDC